MKELERKFKKNEWTLIMEVLKNGRKNTNGSTIKWITLAEKFNIRPNRSRKQRRVAANDVWRRFLRYTKKYNGESKILFYDIEVSYGLARAWRPTWNGTIRYGDFIQHPKIICISWKWKGSDTVETVQWDHEQDDKELLKQFIPILNEADIIVGHNGDRFDLPWIRTRALYYDLEMLPKYESIDTLKVARRQHKLPSNRLDDIGEYFGLGRKIKTDMELWDDVILHGCPKAMEKMVDYCEQDVFLLEKVYDKLTKYSLPKRHVGVANGETKFTSPYTGGNNLELVKTMTTRMGTKRRMMKCLDSGKYFEMSDLNYKRYLKKE